MQGKLLHLVGLSVIFACSSSPHFEVKDASEESHQDTAPTIDDAGTRTTCDNLSWSAVAGSPAGVKIMGSSPTDIWLVANTGVMRGNGSAWASDLFSSPLCTSGSLITLPDAIGLWVSGPNDVLVTGIWSGAPGDFTCPLLSGAIHHWDGSQWGTYQVGDNRGVTTLWGSAPDDVWGTVLPNSGYLGHWDGSTWSHVDSGHHGVIGGGARGDFWIASTGLEHHAPSGFDRTDTLDTVGIDWTNCYLDGCTHAVWASSTDNVWVAANAGHLLHFDGSNWSNVATPATATLRGLSGSSQTDVWAVGNSGTILHYDGSQWTSVGSPTSNSLLGVWASGPCDVWAIGDAVYHASP
jgi:hypothetical protein